MRPVSFAEDLQPGARLSLFSEDKPDRYLTIVESLLESGIGLLPTTSISLQMTTA